MYSDKQNITEVKKYKDKLNKANLKIKEYKENEEIMKSIIKHNTLLLKEYIIKNKKLLVAIKTLLKELEEFGENNWTVKDCLDYVTVDITKLINGAKEDLESIKWEVLVNEKE